MNGAHVLLFHRLNASNDVILATKTLVIISQFINYRRKCDKM